MNMPDRFDLEQQILDCWGITDDLQTLLDSWDNSNMTEDKALNVLIGIKELYDMKFKNTFSTFETLVHTGDIK